MARLPVPGSDAGKWGEVLNEYLLQSHKADGTLRSDAVSNDALANAAVSEVNLDAALVAKINNNTSSGVADGSIINVKLADSSVTSAKIADGTVAESDLAPAVVTKLNAPAVPADGSITTAKLADGSVTLAKLSTSPTPTSGQVLSYNGTGLSWSTPSTGSAVSDATPTSKGIVQLAGDLAGTAASPTVPGLAGKYTKPTSGIPATDLDTATQAAITKAGTSVQSVNGKTGATVSIGVVDMNDATITAPANGQVLTYDSTTSKWKNQTPSSAGGGALVPRSSIIVTSPHLDLLPYLPQTDSAPYGRIQTVNRISVGTSTSFPTPLSWTEPSIQSIIIQNPSTNTNNINIGYGTYGSTNHTTEPVVLTPGQEWVCGASAVPIYARSDTIDQTVTITSIRSA